MKTFTRLNWTTFILLGIGYAIIHGFVVGWLFSNFESRSRPETDSYHITRKGELIRQHYQHGTGQSIFYDEQGNALPAHDYSNMLTFSYVSVNPRNLEKSYPEPRHPVAFNDAATHLTYWYVTEQSDNHDGMYFQLYSLDSQYLIGYVGKRGFSDKIPEKQDRFKYSEQAFYSMRHRLQAINNTTNMMQYSSHEPSAQYNRIAGWNHNFWVAEETVLYKVNMLTHMVTKVAEDNAVRGMGLDYQIDELDKVNFNSNAIDPEILLLYDDKIRFQYEDGKESKVVNLPAELRGMDTYQVGWTIDGRVVIQTTLSNPEEKSSRTDFWWIDKDQKIARHFPRVEKHEHGPNYGEVIAMSFVIPIPALVIFVLLLSPILNFLLTGDPQPLAVQYAEMWREGWLMLLIVSVIGIIVARFAAKYERRYFERPRLAWVIAVGLLGWPGLLAYWFHRHWPHLTREGKQLPLPPTPPKLTGAEVFAY